MTGGVENSESREREKWKELERAGRPAVIVGDLRRGCRCPQRVGSSSPPPFRFDRGQGGRSYFLGASMAVQLPPPAFPLLSFLSPSPSLYLSIFFYFPLHEGGWSSGGLDGPLVASWTFDGLFGLSLSFPPPSFSFFFSILFSVSFFTLEPSQLATDMFLHTLNQVLQEGLANHELMSIYALHVIHILFNNLSICLSKNSET